MFFFFKNQSIFGFIFCLTIFTNQQFHHFFLFPSSMGYQGISLLFPKKEFQYLYLLHTAKYSENLQLCLRHILFQLRQVILHSFLFLLQIQNQYQTILVLTILVLTILSSLLPPKNIIIYLLNRTK